MLVEAPVLVDQGISMAVTLADVARLAGVSTAAVSMVLNGKEGVSEETRARILSLLDETGYKVNRLGRALRQSRTGNIGLYMPNSAVHYSYYTQTTLGVAEALQEHDMSLVIVPSSPDEGELVSLPPVDGFILIEPHSDDRGVGVILEQELPVVSGDVPPVGFPEPWGIVESPNEQTTREVFDRFVAAGAKRPGLLLTDDVSSWSADLDHTYRQWCNERGLEPRVLQADIHLPVDELRERLKPWVAPDTGCDAIFAGGDGIAVRIVGALESFGYRVGESVQVISGVDSPMMEFHSPRITAIDLQPHQFGRACADLLIELLDKPRPEQPLRRVVSAPLIVRETG